MTLPEPARRTWLAHRETLRAAAAAHEPDGRLILAGGTILAARWKHRLSTDIDVLMPDRESLTELGHGQPGELAVRVGGATEHEGLWRVTIGLADGKLDICSLPPLFEGMERRTEVEGRTEVVLDSAQILRGKLERTHAGVTRDAFDMLTAASAEPRALEIAVNALTPGDCLLVRKHLIAASADMAEDVGEALIGLQPEGAPDLSRLGLDAARAIDGHRYARVVVTTADDAIRIEMLARHGGRRTETHAIGEPAQVLATTGMREYVRSNTTLTARDLGSALARAAARQDSVTLLDTADPDPPARVRAYLAG